MLKRWFGRAQKPATAAIPTASAAVAWGPPQTPYRDYFNVHLYAVAIGDLEPALRRTYLAGAVPATPALVLVSGDAWTSAYVEPGLARRVGFNRLASELAHALDTWVIAYRIYAEEGMDVHYFQGAAHLDRLALSGDTLLDEPLTPELFAPLADVTACLPRPQGQHPLDCHFRLLAALGIVDAALTWAEALARHQAGAWAGSRLLSG